MRFDRSGIRLATALAIVCASTSAQTTERVSVDSFGAQANSVSSTPSISADGRYVAFWSGATNLVPGDTNVATDIFVHDLQSGMTTRASVDSSGVQGDSHSYDPSLSADGRCVAFWSWSSNLVPADTNGRADVFVHDRQTGVTRRVSVDSSGAQGNGGGLWPWASISAEGRFVAFDNNASNLVTGDTNADADCFVHDCLTGTTTRVSVSTAGVQGSGYSSRPAISADGRYVAFTSGANNLVPGDTGWVDVFVHDCQSGVITRVSVDSSGLPADSGCVWPTISTDGRFVAFTSGATNLVPGDTNGATDIFVHDLQSAVTMRASVDSSGTQGNGASGFGYATPSSITADGRYVAFYSGATNLVPGDTNGNLDVFVHDRGAASSFTALCFGDGSVAACPCNNSGQTGHGCENSSGSGGAVLSATGEASLSAASVQLTSSGELPQTLSIAFQGSSTIVPILYGDGLRCLDGDLLRLYVKTAVGGTVTAPEAGDPPIPVRSALLGDPILLGTSRFYHVYYRDLGSSFCPAPGGGRFNVTNAIAITWGS